VASCDVVAAVSTGPFYALDRTEPRWGTAIRQLSSALHPPSFEVRAVLVTKIIRASRATIYDARDAATNRVDRFDVHDLSTRETNRVGRSDFCDSKCGGIVTGVLTFTILIDAATNRVGRFDVHDLSTPRRIVSDVLTFAIRNAEES
jgi:hypothetical protein